VHKSTNTNIEHAVSSLSYNKFSIEDLNKEFELDEGFAKRTSYQQEVTKLVAKLNQFYGTGWNSLVRRRALVNWSNQPILQETSTTQQISNSLKNLDNYFIQNGNIFKVKETA
jgi:hypothetical protein